MEKTKKEKWIMRLVNGGKALGLTILLLIILSVSPGMGLMFTFFVGVYLVFSLKEDILKISGYH